MSKKKKKSGCFGGAKFQEIKNADGTVSVVKVKNNSEVHKQRRFDQRYNSYMVKSSLSKSEKKRHDIQKSIE